MLLRSTFRIGISIFLFVSLSLFFLISASALTFNVDSTADMVDNNIGNGTCETATAVCTLRAAIQEANANVGPHTINLPAGTYSLSIAGSGENLAATGDLDIDETVTIVGADQTTTIIDANGIDRAFHLTAQGVLVNLFTLSNVTIQNGDSMGDDGGAITTENTREMTLTNVTLDNNTTNGGWGGAIYQNSGQFTATGITVSNNSAVGDAGGIDIEGDGTITSSTFTMNAVDGYGGGISFYGSDLSLNNVNFINNTSTSDAAALYNDGGNVVYEQGTVSGNVGNEFGGAISSSGILDITGVTFSNNESTSDGGGAIYGSDDTTITQCIFQNNEASGSSYGGAIYHDSGLLEINNSTFSGNTSINEGGAIYVEDELEINQSIFTSNSATTDGGAIYEDGISNVSITDTYFYQNTADGDGGAIYHYTDDIIIDKGSFLSNTAIGGGGAVYSAGEITIENSTFSENSADSGGGHSGESISSITNSTFYNNSASDQGSNIYSSDEIELLNTILHSDSGDGCSIDTTTSLGYNIESNDTCDLTGTGDQTNTDAMLDTSAYAYATYRYVHPILPGSPAIDTGNNASCTLEDGRGVTRPVDGDGDTNADCDIGAYEFQSDTDISVTISSPGEIIAGNPINYTITVTNNGPGDSFDMDLEVVVDDLLTGATWTCSVGTGNGSCDPISGTFASPDNTTIDLTNGSVATFTVSGTVPDTAPSGNISASATITLASGMTETASADNSASGQTTITAADAGSTLVDAGIDMLLNITAGLFFLTATFTVVAYQTNPKAKKAINNKVKGFNLLR